MKLDGSMPEELVNHLSQLDFRTRGAVVASWYAIGEEGRAHYRQYLTSPRLRRSRRRRAERAVARLLDPPEGWPTPFTSRPPETAEAWDPVPPL